MWWHVNGFPNKIAIHSIKAHEVIKYEYLSAYLPLFRTYKITEDLTENVWYSPKLLEDNLFFSVASAEQLTENLKILHLNENIVCMSLAASF